MKCPNCGVELKRKRAKLPLALPFSSPERKAKLKNTKLTRTVYVCDGCGASYILTLVLKRIAIATS